MLHQIVDVVDDTMSQLIALVLGLVAGLARHRLFFILNAVVNSLVLTQLARPLWQARGSQAVSLTLVSSGSTGPAGPALLYYLSMCVDHSA